MKKYLVLFIAYLSVNQSFSQTFQIKAVKDHITYLASDKLEGRGTGTKGEQLAAAYIIKQFKAIGLKPLGDNEGFLQEFTAKKGLPPNQTTVKANNVVGYLDNGAENTIIIGAHYDHLGIGDQGSSLKANSKGDIHNGADDNASGVSGILELAAYYSGNGIRENNNFLFIAFSGEELGLIGSKYFTEHPTIDLKKVNAMINLDMIGRYREDKGVSVGGYGTSNFWGSVVPGIAGELNIRYTVDSSGIGPSDHSSFYLKDIPVFFLFTGGHQEYHKPTDDAHLINYEGEVLLLNFLSRVIGKIDSAPKIAFRKVSDPHGSGSRQASSFKVSLGVMPDYSFSGEGLRIDGVTEGRAAAKAGFEAGDVLLELGDYKIKDIYEYMDALGKHEKGQTIKAKIKRKDEILLKEVTF